MKKGIFIVIISFILGSSVNAFAQVNLVLNPSFEDVVGCPEGQSSSILDSAVHWFNPTSNTVDLFLSCTPISSFNHVPDNAWGWQVPNSGQNYAGISADYSDPHFSQRDYIGGSLAEPLIQGEEYVISVHVSSSSSFSSRFKGLGMYFSDTMPIKKYDPFPVIYYQTLPVSPQIIYDTLISDTISWVKLVDTLRASGGELYFAIGLFTDNLSSTFDTVYYDSTNQFTIAYYFIDDISVTKIYDTAPPPAYPEITLFPNPSSDGVFTLQYEFNVDGVLEIYNALGQIVFKKSLQAGAVQETIDLSERSSGAYYYRIIRSGEELKTGKLVISK